MSWLRIQSYITLRQPNISWVLSKTWKHLKSTCIQTHIVRVLRKANCTYCLRPVVIARLIFMSTAGEKASWQRGWMARTLALVIWIDNKAIIEYMIFLVWQLYGNGDFKLSSAFRKDYLDAFRYDFYYYYFWI